MVVATGASRRVSFYDGTLRISSLGWDDGVWGKTLCYVVGGVLSKAISTLNPR